MTASKTKDYYKTLGVDRKADAKSIKAAFRKLARKWHPDVNPGNDKAEDEFKALNEAFDVLSDPASRKLYDRFGDEWSAYRDAGYTGDEPAPAGFGRTANGRSSGPQFRYQSSADEGGFDFVQSLFGNRRGGEPFGSTRTVRRQGQDLELALEVTFDEAFRGTSRRIDIQTPETCVTCDGTGVVKQSRCPICHGVGTISMTKTIEVTIPAGVATGSKVRVAGQGRPGMGGGPHGDVLISVTVQVDKWFERAGDNLKTVVDVPLYAAILGGEIVVPTPGGKVALSIPANSQNGRVFRLRGQGMPKLKSAKGERGDLLARISVTLPTDLSDREISLFRELQAIRHP
jgi:molecular chaperone DnaJ